MFHRRYTNQTFNPRSKRESSKQENSKSFSKRKSHTDKYMIVNFRWNFESFRFSFSKDRKKKTFFQFSSKKDETVRDRENLFLQTYFDKNQN